MTIQKLKRSIAAALAVAGAIAFGTAATAWGDEATPKTARQTLEVFKKADPGLARVLDESAGYAVLPNVAKGAVGIGGAAGNGVLFEHGKPVGRVGMSQVTIGLQLGGQAYSELLVFKDAAALTQFKRGNLELAAQASAIAVTTGASANASYQRGVQVFTLAKGGLMYEASIGGQRFTFTPYAKEKVGLLIR